MSGGVAMIDYDNDDYPDLYFTNAPSVAMYKAGTRARSALYHNNHDGTFTDVTEKAGVGYPCWAMGAAVGDFDNDGWPDLAVSCFGSVVLYRNNHDGTLTDVTKKAGLDRDKGWATGLTFGDVSQKAGVDDPQKYFGLQGVWTDIDGDGRSTCSSRTMDSPTISITMKVTASSRK